MDLLRQSQTIVAINLVIETEIKGPGVLKIIRKASVQKVTLSAFFFDSIRHGLRVPRIDKLYTLSFVLETDVRNFFTPRDVSKAESFLSLNPTEQRTIARIFANSRTEPRNNKILPVRVHIRKPGMEILKKSVPIVSQEWKGV